MNFFGKNNDFSLSLQLAYQKTQKHHIWEAPNNNPPAGEQITNNLRIRKKENSKPGTHPFGN
jgi:hypothetical protein